MKQVLNRSWILVGAVALLAFSISCSDKKDDPTVNPVAGFTFTASELVVTFTNTSTDGVSYTWEFGDGTTSTDENPVHTFAEAGDYDVILTVVGETGSTPDSETKTVSVSEIVVVDPCDSYNGEQADNLIIGGQFEECDAKYWSVLLSGQKNGSGDLQGAKYELGYTNYKPSTGAGGSLYIFPDNDDATGEEGTILYQELTLTAGEYQVGADVKVAGENAENPTAAMNSYWFEIVLNTAVPMESDGYNYDRVTGWYYGGWTGNAALAIPAVDGEMPYALFNTNQANNEGKFNVAEAGTYYLVIKFGKGNDADGASFGDGIALDNLSLKRIGDVVNCDSYDGSQTGNLVTGGQFEECDDANWTIVGTGAKHLPKVTFGSTKNAPAGGVGGSFVINDPDRYVSGDQAEMVMYTSIELDAAKTYVVSGLIKHGPLTATTVADGGPKEAFMSLEIADAAPAGGTGWKDSQGNDAKVLLQRYCVCWYGGESPAVNGAWINDPTASWISYATNSDLEFTVPTSGTYYIGFKAGLGTAAGATFSADGYSVDNLVISEK